MSKPGIISKHRGSGPAKVVLHSAGKSTVRKSGYRGKGKRGLELSNCTNKGTVGDTMKG
ncbi:hypothetical protein N6H13_22445 [Paenibacillus sp. CC-CFT742]|nr:hypothetical protein [Paenibacillus sp. CC-CFT742]WJH27894.1 hypothetical protein N6H13_22445 [Paenibacillus sp. CC-CFT742]